MNLAFVDFETFWSDTHTLKKMSPVQYVMHPDTEIISCAMDFNGVESVQFGEASVAHQLSQVDWTKTMVVGHNMSVFDALLMAWRFKIRPLMWGCTLAMARPLHAKTCGLSLAKLAEHYGVGIKDNTALLQTKGKHLADFTLPELKAMANYNTSDTRQCKGIFHAMKPHFTSAELWHIDANIRMFVEPEFELDTGLLQHALSVERANKHRDLLDLAKILRPETKPERAFETCEATQARVLDLDEYDAAEFWGDEVAVAMWTRTQMASSAKFSEILTARGVEVPLKRSKTDPKKKIPAIAKTDEPMTELLDHDDPVVAAAARARLSTKSTQLETRIQSFLDTYSVLGKLPVPAHYCGADTTGRDSGFLYNMYNLPRVNPKKPKVSDALRRSVRAPDGFQVVVADLSGIELRVNHTLWQVERSMAMWRANADADLYIGTATDYYGAAPGEITKDDPRRQLGKVLELACGFGIGHKKLRDQARAQYGLKLSLEESDRGVKTWRNRYPEIAGRDGGWKRCEEVLHYIANGDKVAIDPWGLCWTEQDAVVLPSGRRIRYPNLRQEWVTKYVENDDGELEEKKERSWVYADGRHKAYLYGGKVDENLVQALARDVIFPNAITMWQATGYRPKHKVYDELVYLVPTAQAQGFLDRLQEIMRTPPPWWQEIVLWSEGSYGDCYADAK